MARLIGMLEGRKLVLAAVSAFIVAGCGKSAQVRQAGAIAPGAPDWVNKGSGAFKEASGNSVLYGVGIIQGVRNRSLEVTAADENARAEVAKTMNDYVAVLTKEYMASTTAGDMSKSSEEQDVSQTLKTFAKFTLNGSTIVDHWRDPADGTMFSLCKLDMAAIKAALDNAKDLDAKVRDYVRANADKAFQDLSAEEAKH